jgi:hypothetical protein
VKEDDDDNSVFECFYDPSVVSRVVCRTGVGLGLADKTGACQTEAAQPTRSAEALHATIPAAVMGKNKAMK